MTIDALRCFCAVVDTGSFREAAARVYRSQPAVSQQIKSLERELGHVLLDRRTSAPTAVGKILYERGKAILIAEESLREELADIDEAWSRELRVGSSDTVALHLLPDVVGAFSAKMPSTRLVIVSRSTAAVVAQVLSGAVDLGVVTLPVSHPDLHEQALWDLTLTGVAPRGHALAGKARVTLKQFTSYPFLALEPETRTGSLIREYFRREDVEPHVALDSGSFEVIKRYVTEGLGVSIVPERIVGGGERLVKVRIPRLPVLRIGVVWRRGAYHSRATRRFLALLGEENH